MTYVCQIHRKGHPLDVLLIAAFTVSPWSFDWTVNISSNFQQNKHFSENISWWHSQIIFLFIHSMYSLVQLCKIWRIQKISRRIWPFKPSLEYLVNVIMLSLLLWTSSFDTSSRRWSTGAFRIQSLLLTKGLRYWDIPSIVCLHVVNVSLDLAEVSLVT